MLCQAANGALMKMLMLAGLAPWLRKYPLTFGDSCSFLSHSIFPRPPCDLFVPSMLLLTSLPLPFHLPLLLLFLFMSLLYSTEISMHLKPSSNAVCVSNVFCPLIQICRSRLLKKFALNSSKLSLLSEYVNPSLYSIFPLTSWMKVI